MKDILIAVVFAGIIGFIVGVQSSHELWEASAKRGYFEIGHILYKVEVIKP